MGRIPKELERILRATSRSFYLSLRAAPSGVRAQLGLAYLFCRTADTIADTQLLPPERRLELLGAFREQFAREAPEEPRLREIAGAITGTAPVREERILIESLPSCFRCYVSFPPEDRHLIRRLVATLTGGMEMDLRIFPTPAGPAEHPAPVPLPDDETLDRYCYHVAGCVGEFWTDLTIARIPALSPLDRRAMREKGVRFGKGLQLTNILRDFPKDLRLGRCYLPRTRLERIGVRAADLRGGGSEREPLPRAIGSVIDDLLDLTLEHYRSAWEYTLALPRRPLRLRLACAWPLLIGLATLARVRQEKKELLAGKNLKISRGEVRKILLVSTLCAASNSALDRIYRRLESVAKRKLTTEGTEDHRGG